jgi:transcriptional regulator with XRE-family HTH domain
MPADPWSAQVESLGRFIHSQRKLAKLSLRELSALSGFSNAYLSQLERGLHEPSIRAITALARALGLPAETLLRHAGMFDDPATPEPGSPGAPEPGSPATRPSAEDAIRADPALTPAQREALLSVYRGFASGGGDTAP